MKADEARKIVKEHIENFDYELVMKRIYECVERHATLGRTYCQIQLNVYTTSFLVIKEILAKLEDNGFGIGSVRDNAIEIEWGFEE